MSTLFKNYTFILLHISRCNVHSFRYHFVHISLFVSYCSSFSVRSFSSAMFCTFHRKLLNRMDRMKQLVSMPWIRIRNLTKRMFHGLCCAVLYYGMSLIGRQIGWRKERLINTYQLCIIRMKLIFISICKRVVRMFFVIQRIVRNNPTDNKEIVDYRKIFLISNYCSCLRSRYTLSLFRACWWI